MLIHLCPKGYFKQCINVTCTYFAQAHMRIMHIYNKDAKNSLCQEDDQQINNLRWIFDCKSSLNN